MDEAYVFVCYDSRKDRARFTPHTGLQHHSVGPDAPPRYRLTATELGTNGIVSL